MAKTKVLISEQDRTAWVLPETISTTDSLKIKSDSCSFEMVVQGWEIGKPQGGNTVQILDEAENEILFAGVIEEVTQKLLNPVTFQYSCEASDWTKFFDRRLVNEKKSAISA